jgi:hypothetical protein
MSPLSPPALAMGLCVAMIAFVRLPSLKVSCLLLSGLLIYDVFWVSVFHWASCSPLCLIDSLTAENWPKLGLPTTFSGHSHPSQAVCVSHIPLVDSCDTAYCMGAPSSTGREYFWALRDIQKLLGMHEEQKFSSSSKLAKY